MIYHITPSGMLSNFTAADKHALARAQAFVGLENARNNWLLCSHADPSLKGIGIDVVNDQCQSVCCKLATTDCMGEAGPCDIHTASQNLLPHVLAMHGARTVRTEHN